MFFLKYLAIMIFISISTYSSSLANLDILSVTKESSTSFPIALYITTSILTMFFLVYLFNVILIPIAFSVLIYISIRQSKDFLNEILLTFMLIFSSHYTATNLISYYGNNGIEKILKDTYYIKVKHLCNFKNENKTWLSYLGGGKVSVLTLDESGNYHFESRPCKPKDSLGESKA
ncbi:hypothetical protein TW85_01750 [Marinomonas sp. S3726]|nr:hypothetical protein TW85_01750 [Marinomonas sp. S3726]